MRKEARGKQRDHWAFESVSHLYLPLFPMASTASLPQTAQSSSPSTAPFPNPSLLPLNSVPSLTQGSFITDFSYRGDKMFDRRHLNEEGLSYGFQGSSPPWWWCGVATSTVAGAGAGAGGDASLHLGRPRNR